MTRLATMLIAVWLFLTGLKVPYLAQAAFPQYLVAAGIVLVEVLALTSDAARWGSFLLGAWLVVAPLLLGYPGPLGALNSFACGLMIVVLAAHPTTPASYEEPPEMQKRLFAHRGGGEAVR